MNENMKITNKNWNPQDLFCGYIVMSADRGGLATSRDVSHMLFY